MKKQGRGLRRTYSLWDALLCAIIREMHELGLPITGPGEELSGAAESWVWYRGHNGEDLSSLESLALIPTGDDWDMLQLPDALREHRSFVVLGIRQIVEGVVQRYHAVSP